MTLTPEMIARISQDVIAGFDLTPNPTPTVKAAPKAPKKTSKVPKATKKTAPAPTPTETPEAAEAEALWEKITGAPAPADKPVKPGKGTSPEQALLAGSPYETTTGQVHLTREVMLGVAEFDGSPQIVPSGRNYPAAVLISGPMEAPVLQNLQAK